MINKIKKYIIDGTYEIKFISNFRRFQGIPVKGLIEPDTDTILICKKINQEEQIITLIHEFIHEIKPHWKEQKVERESIKLFSKLTHEDLVFFQKITNK